LLPAEAQERGGMMHVRAALNHALSKIGYEIIKTDYKIDGGSIYSEEQRIISTLLQTLPLKNNYCVDIGASDGIISSNTLFLFKDKWPGVAVEYNAEKFARLAFTYKRFEQVNLVKAKVIPDNVVHILKSCSAPDQFAFLNLDIDGYDYYVLDQLLSQYRPMLISAEINEKIPPPIKFTVKYDPGYQYEGDHFFGQSLSQLFELCKRYQYRIVEVYYNNALLIPSELSPRASLTPESAYVSGYKDRRERKTKFPWNADVEVLLQLSPPDGVQFIHKLFEKYKGKYICEL
jgi:hypothetical protein